MEANVNNKVSKASTKSNDNKAGTKKRNNRRKTRPRNLYQYDYIQVMFCDINGVHRSKIFPRKSFDTLFNEEAELYIGEQTYGPRYEHVDLQMIDALEHGNAHLQVYRDTLFQIHWSEEKLISGKEAKIGCMLVDLTKRDGKILEASPRNMAQSMVSRLEEKHNLVIKSAFEPEFQAFKLNSVADMKSVKEDPNANYPTPIPYTIGKDMLSTTYTNKYRQFFMSLHGYMSKIRINLLDFSVENASAQLETPLETSYGLKAADQFFIFKQASKEIALQHGMFLSFMTSPLNDILANGNHFNHSLWNPKDETNAFSDENDPDGLSEIARYWLGGLMEHLPAILVFASPTPNCYRRLRKEFAPATSNWLINSRFASFRVKNLTTESTYIENRLVSSAACPYHVLGATLAAGMDGIERRILPNQNPKQLPSTLKESIELLKSDQIFIDIMGREFIDCYLQVKQGSDLYHLKDIDISKAQDIDFMKERQEYFQFI